MEIVLELNFHWIDTRFAVGGRLPRHAGPQLARTGISRVVDMHSEDRDDDSVAVSGIEVLRLPTPDREPVTQEVLSEGVRWVNRALAGGHGVLVHCEHGIGRAPLMAACVLVSYGAAPLAAIARLEQRRRVVSPSPAQLTALLGWARAFAPAAPPATVDDLGRIVWTALP